MRTRVVLGPVVVAAVVVGAVVLWRGNSDAPSGQDAEGPPPLSLAGEPTSADAFAPQTVGYHLVGPLPEMGGTATVYRLVPPTIGDADLAEMAAGVGVEGTVSERDGRRVVADSSGEVEANRALGQWGVNYINTSGDPDPFPYPGAPAPDVPEGADLERIGRDLVGALGVRVDGWQVSTDGGLAVRNGNQVFGRTASFAPMFDEVPYSLLAWNVSVFDGGTVGFASGSMTDWVEVGDYPLRPASDAYDDLVTGTALMPFHTGMHGVDLSNVTITGVEQTIAMFAGTHNGEEVGYLVPTYRFSVDVAGDDGAVSFEVAAIEPRFIDTIDTTSGD